MIEAPAHATTLHTTVASDSMEHSNNVQRGRLLYEQCCLKEEIDSLKMGALGCYASAFPSEMSRILVYFAYCTKIQTIKHGVF